MYALAIVSYIFASCAIDDEIATGVGWLGKDGFDVNGITFREPTLYPAESLIPGITEMRVGVKKT